MIQKFFYLSMIYIIVFSFGIMKPNNFRVEVAKAENGLVTIQANQDKKYILDGDTNLITVTVNVKNPTSITADHVRVDLPIADSMTLKESSISDGGQFLGDKIVWLLPDMKAGSELNLTYKYQVGITPVVQKYYVATNGNDNNSGTLEEPLATINGARLKIRAYKNKITVNDSLDKSIEVDIRAGRYYFDSQVVFTADDSGTDQYPITYKKYDADKDEVVFVGGSKVTGSWSPMSEGSPIYKTNIGVSSWKPNNLIVNGVQAILAKDPNNGYYIADAYIDPADQTKVLTAQPTKTMPDGSKVVVPNCEYLSKTNVNDTLSSATKNLTNVRVHSYVRWSETSRPINSIDPTGIIRTSLTSANINPDISYCYNGGYPDDRAKAGKVRYTLENVFEKLDIAGEWYFDPTNGDLYYWPRVGDNMDTATVEASKTTVILNFKQSPINPYESNNTSYINIEGIKFTGTQTGYQALAATQNLGALSVVNASHLKIIGNTFYGTGGSGVYALSYNPGNYFSHILIQKNTFANTGFDGVMLSNSPIIVPPSTIPKIVPTYNTIIDNKFTNFGTVVTSPAISIPNSSGLLVENNDIDGGGYAGIAGSDNSTALGEGVVVPDVTFASDLPMTMISKNRITNVMQKLNDGGGIYVGHARNLPFSIDNNIVSNLVATAFHYDNNEGFAGIYLDDAQSNTSVTNNLVYNADIGLDTNMSGINNRIVNNIFAKIINTGFYSWYITLKEYMGSDLSGNGQAAQTDSQKLLLKKNIVQFTDSATDETRFIMMRSMIRYSGLNLFSPSMLSGKNDLFIPTGYDWKKYYNANVTGELSVEPDSISADPQFVDPANNDFDLQSTSPAFDLGFKSIDLSRVGTDW